MNRSFIRVGAVVVALAPLAIVGCSSSSTATATSPATTTGASSPATSTPATGATLTIAGFAFGPLTATAGQQITIVNKDSAAHTVTDDAGSFDVKVAAGGTATLTIAKAGSYKIHCKIHSSMHGTIAVN
jgi:plastocyanin